MIALLLAASAWLTASRAGFAWLMQSLGGLSGNAVSVKQAEGTLWDGFKLSDVRVRSAGSDVDIESVQLDWNPSALWQRQLWLRQLAVGHVKVAVKPTPATPPGGAPESLALPLSIRLDKLSVASLTLEPAKLRLYGLEAGYVYDGRRHDLKLKRLGSPWGEAEAALQLADAKPFALQGKLSAGGELDKIPYQAKLALGGDLLQLSFDGELAGKGLVADVKGGLLPFASNPFNSFTRLDARMAGINPQAILPEWPRAKLSLAVFAEPDAGQRVKGGLTLLNEQAGPCPSKSCRCPCWPANSAPTTRRWSCSTPMRGSPTAKSAWPARCGRTSSSWRWTFPSWGCGNCTPARRMIAWTAG